MKTGKEGGKEEEKEMVVARGSGTQEIMKREAQMGLERQVVGEQIRVKASFFWTSVSPSVQ